MWLVSLNCSEIFPMSPFYCLYCAGVRAIDRRCFLFYVSTLVMTIACGPTDFPSASLSFAAPAGLSCFVEHSSRICTGLGAVSFFGRVAIA